MSKKPNRNKNKHREKAIDFLNIMIVIGAIIIVLSTGISAYISTKPSTSNMTFNDFYDHIESGDVDAVNIIESANYMIVKLNNGESYTVTNPDYDEFKKELLESGVELSISRLSLAEAILSSAMSLPLTLLMFLVFAFIAKSVLLKSSSSSYGISKPDKTVTFKDIAGMSEAKEEVRFAVTQLTNSNKLKSLGAHPCRGILLEGPPGTGKTLLARAIANEANVPFISANGSDFIEIFAGLGAAKIRNLWALAMQNAPCILFIDEIDTLGRQRSSGGDGASLESNQTLNQLLGCMDGLVRSNGILVIGATNRASDLDPALMRPGRFDKKIYIGPPKTKKDRDEIVSLHLKNKKVSEDIKLDQISKLMFGLSGAEIEQVLNEAVLISLQSNRDGVINLSDIDNAVMKLRTAGIAIPQSSKDDILISSVHEAGHAVMSALLGRKSSKISIRSYSSGVGGLTVRDTDDIENIKILTRNELINDVKVLLAGRAAEKLILGSSSAGCSNDIEKATKLVYDMLYCFAMDDDNLANPNALNNDIKLDDANKLNKVNNQLIQINKEVERALSNEITEVNRLAKQLTTDEDIFDYYYKNS